jgi:hypothetical protein
MDDTLTLNLCPFRSQNWATLHKKRRSIAFSRDMWADIFEITEPACIVCCGRPPAKELGKVLRKARGAQPVDFQSRPIVWASYRYELTRYRTPKGTVTLVYIPHLSHFPIFGREASREACAEIVQAITQAMGDGR